MPKDDQPPGDQHTDGRPHDDRQWRADAGRAVPVVPICSLTESQRIAAAGSVLIDLEDGVQLSFDLLLDRGLIRRRVHDLLQVIEDTEIEMEHGCAHCSLRDVVTSSLQEWAERRRPIVLALPPTTEPATIVPDLIAAAGAVGRQPYGIGSVVVAIDSAVVESDLFGDDLLDERGIANGASDRRSVGEVVAHQIEYADVVVFDAPLSGRQSTLLDHLMRPTGAQTEVHRLSGSSLLTAGSARRSQHRVPGCSSYNAELSFPTGVADSDGIWTIDLRSERPMSPDRLRQELGALGTGPLRGRGHFWLPTRPELRCVWDGAGGQLSIGPAGEWDGERQTRLVITGAGGDPDAVAAAFERTLLTDAEFVEGAASWAQVDDGMDPWLGTRLSHE